MNSQSYKLKKIPINNGLDSKLRSKVPYIDSDGFLWYIIRGGIVKEYGVTRIVYPMRSPNDSNYNSSVIYKTKNNQLWVATNIGAYCLDLKTGKSFWVQRLKKENNNFIEFSSFIEGSDGTIWMGTRSNKLFSYSLGGVITSFAIDDSFYNVTESFYNGIVIKEELANGSLLLFKGNKWFQFKDFKFKLLIDFSPFYRPFYGDYFISFSPNKSQFKEGVSGSYKFLDKTYHYFYVKEINKLITSVPYNRETILSGKNKKNTEELFKTVAINEHKIIFSSFKLKNNKIEYEKLNEVDTGSRIRDLGLDNEGKILIQNEDRFHLTKQLEAQFETFLNNKEEYGVKTTISCRSIIEQSDGSIIVFSVGNGFFKLSPKADKFKQLSVAKELNNYIYGVHKQNDSILWGYGYGKHLFKINLNTKKVTSFFSKIPGPIEHSTYDIEQISDDKLIVGGSFGLEEFNLKTKQFRDLSKIGPYNIRNKTVGEIYFDKEKNTLWIGMLKNGGLYKKNLSQDSVIHFSSKNKEYPLVNDNVRYIYKSEQNSIWIGTENGLQNIHQDNSTSLKNKIKITEENITGIYEKGNNVWYATYNGLKKLNKTTKKIESFYKYDGLPDNEFNYKSVFEDSKGNIYFGGINGLLRFNPYSKIAKTKPSKIFLAEIKKFDEQSTTNKSFVYNVAAIKSFDIPYNRNYLTLKFGINDLFNYDNNVYFYRIKKINKEWIALGNNGTIQLNGIAPNTYTLEVKGRTPNGIETNILSYKVYIEQVFYKTWWFLTIIIILIILSFLRISFYKIKQIKKKESQKVKLLNLEAKALRAQMNSHFIFNILNSLQNLIIINDEREVNRVFSEFSKLIRYTLNMSRTEFIPFEKEVEYIKSYISMEKFRLNNNLDFKLSIEENIGDKQIKIPCMLFQPIIENAIVHGLKPKRNNRKLEIVFSCTENSLIGIVKDNGIGREASSKNNQRKYNSVGTHILKERIETLNYQKKNKILIKFIDLKDKGKGVGSVVELIIPTTHS
ncbi:histidine kinase [uncultured Tenacibaculum sp.]|uniref:sensor histidine kinase n=1 Tax=uncultured Tenacibaculum sp. TaxID=174713 RepID=UPI00261E4C1A|nr:histidine kinase [uncultured Tenacibaculum sp.]